MKKHKIGVIKTNRTCTGRKLDNEFSYLRTSVEQNQSAANRDAKNLRNLMLENAVTPAIADRSEGFPSDFSLFSFFHFSIFHFLIIFR